MTLAPEGVINTAVIKVTAGRSKTGYFSEKLNCSDTSSIARILFDMKGTFCIHNKIFSPATYEEITTKKSSAIVFFKPNFLKNFSVTDK